MGNAANHARDTHGMSQMVTTGQPPFTKRGSVGYPFAYERQVGVDEFSGADVDDGSRRADHLGG